MDNGKKTNAIYHQDHKKRMRERFLKNPDFSGFAEHEIVELLLNFSLVRKNANETAHELCNVFGSLDGILNADFDELTKINGISDQTATFLKMQYSLLRYYNLESAKRKKDFYELADEILGRFMSMFSKLDREFMYMICVDPRGNIHREHCLSSGSASSVSVSVASVIESAVKDKAATVFLAHNHPNGLVYPSQDDLNLTFETKYALDLLQITLSEHYIIGENSYYPILKNEKDHYKKIRK